MGSTTQTKKIRAFFSGLNVIRLPPPKKALAWRSHCDCICYQTSMSQDGKCEAPKQRSSASTLWSPSGGLRLRDAWLSLQLAGSSFDAQGGLIVVWTYSWWFDKNSGNIPKLKCSTEYVCVIHISYISKKHLALTPLFPFGWTSLGSTLHPGVKMFGEQEMDEVAAWICAVHLQ